jgi:alpha-1,3-rhamnosyl/mannosyltransferase
VEAVRRRYEVPQAFILYVGINKPHKNLARLVAAFAQLAVQIPDVALVLAGRPDPRYDDAQRAVTEFGIAGRVRFIGDVAQADLPALYSSAACFAFPSLYEGFGLPVLEAMACGTPVVCSNAGSLPEVVGDAAIQVPPQDVHALAAALMVILQDGRLWTRLHRAGLVRAQAFTWERTARETLRVYEAARSTRCKGLGVARSPRL